MTKRKSTKSALLSSALALFLCFTMLLGTTYAWFTDSVTSANNVIKTGSLKVDLEVLETDNATWTSVKESNAPIFDYQNWEPGYVQVKVLRVVNEGTLALKWKAHLEGNKDAEIAKVIDVYVKEDVEAYPADRAEIETWTHVGTLSEFINSIETTTTGEILPNAEKNAYEALGIAFKMQETAGNEYQEADLGAFTLRILATQLTAEGDSFDDQYDKDASLDDVKSEKEITLTDENAGDSIVIGKMEDVTLDLADQTLNNTLVNNGTLSATGGAIETPKNATGAAAVGFQNHGEATLTDVTMSTGSSSDYGNILYAGSTTTYQNVEIVTAGGGIGVTDGAKATFESGSVYVDSASTSARYLFYVVGEGSELTIDGGTFSWDPSDNQKRAYVYVGAGSTVYITGGTFGAASTRSGYTAGLLGDGTIIITGGTFGFNPSNWVADGYEAVKNGDVWVVSAKA